MEGVQQLYDSTELFKTRYEEIAWAESCWDLYIAFYEVAGNIKTDFFEPAQVPFIKVITPKEIVT